LHVSLGYSVSRWYIYIGVGHEKVARLPFCTCPCDILSGVSIYISRRVFEPLVSSCAVNMLRFTRRNVVILMAATLWFMLSFSSCIMCVPSEKFTPPPPQFQWGDTSKVRYKNQIRTRYRNCRTTSATQLQPSKSLRYIGYTLT